MRLIWVISGSPWKNYPIEGRSLSIAMQLPAPDLQFAAANSSVTAQACPTCFLGRDRREVY
jgi:hypothetical protein